MQNKVGLLMAPALLPSCFSLEEDVVAPAFAAEPVAVRTVRLRDVVAAIRRGFAARAAASRNSSAAAW